MDTLKINCNNLSIIEQQFRTRILNAICRLFLTFRTISLHIQLKSFARNIWKVLFLYNSCAPVHHFKRFMHPLRLGWVCYSMKEVEWDFGSQSLIKPSIQLYAWEFLRWSNGNCVEHGCANTRNASAFGSFIFKMQTSQRLLFMTLEMLKISTMHEQCDDVLWINLLCVSFSLSEQCYSLCVFRCFGKY